MVDLYRPARLAADPDAGCAGGWRVLLSGRCRRGRSRHDGRMSDPSGPAGPDPLYYPDVAVAGDLRTALQNTFDAAGVPLRALHVSSPGWLRVGAEARAGDRHVDVVMAKDGRVFLLRFWMRGMRMASGSTDDLDDTAAAISMFLSGVGVRQLGVSWPFVSFGGFAEAFAHGEHEAITYRWRQYLDSPPARARYMLDLRDFLTAALGEPRLRALFPFTSHQDLGFRRSVCDMPSPALAWVRPFGEGQYLIAGADRRQLYTAGPVRRTIWGGEPVPGALGPAGAQDSVALVLVGLDREPQA